MIKKDLVTINCPVCGAQMLPSEVFLPNSFFGKQTDIHRKADGTIDFYLGDDMDLDEEYICEYCSTALNIHANLSFTVTEAPNMTFDEEYTTSLSKPKKLKLEEESLFD